MKTLRGFTLVEMSVVLFLMGFLLVALPRLLTDGSQQQMGQPGATTAETAAMALHGFVLRNNRLPYPAASVSSGVEDPGRKTGYLPWKSLGLPTPLRNGSGFEFWYGIYTKAGLDLGSADDVFTPSYLDIAGVGSYTSAIDPATYSAAAITRTSNVTNGLDFCDKLRSASLAALDSAQIRLRKPGGNTAVVNAPWVLVDPGANNAFDGSNKTAATLSGSALVFESAGRVQDVNYDDKVTAGGFNQMFAELKCPSLLAAASGAAREADFAFENWRLLRFYADFRKFEVTVRNKAKDMAYNQWFIAVADVTLAAAMTVEDLAIALGSISGAVEIAVTVVNAVIAIAMAVQEVTGADAALTSAQADVVTANARSDQAVIEVTNAGTFLANRRAAVQAIDNRGWFQ